jgi:hypothetical protein
MRRCPCDRQQIAGRMGSPGPPAAQRRGPEAGILVAPGASMHRATLLLPALLATGLAAAHAETPPGVDCPGYAALLRSARTRLERGDRAGSLRDLRRARDLLDRCRTPGPQAVATALG